MYAHVHLCVLTHTCTLVCGVVCMWGSEGSLEALSFFPFVMCVLRMNLGSSDLLPRSFTKFQYHGIALALALVFENDR